MTQNSFSIQPFEAKRVRFESTRSFDEVLLNLRKLVGTARLQGVNKQTKVDAIDSEPVEPAGTNTVTVIR